MIDVILPRWVGGLLAGAVATVLVVLPYASCHIRSLQKENAHLHQVVQSDTQLIRACAETLGIEVDPP